VREERDWVHKRLQVALQKTRIVLDAVKSDAFADDNVFNEMLEMQSLQIVLTALNGKENDDESLATQVFMSMFTDEEWNELQVSEQAIGDADEGKLRLLRLNRQYVLLCDAQTIAIDLTVRDENVAGEQTELVKKCTQVIKVVLDRMGMNGRAVVHALPPVAAAEVAVPGRSQAPARNAGAKQKNQKDVVVQQKRKKKKKKREERSQEAGNEEMVVEEGDGKKAKTSSEDNDEADEENEEEVDEENVVQQAQEEQDDDDQMMEEDNKEQEGVDIETILEKAKLDVNVVLSMSKERNKDGAVTLKISRIDVPDARCATADAGSVVLLDDIKLSQCLCESSIPDDLNTVERWSRLLKWWRLVNRCFAIAGIFAHLRAQKKSGGLNLKKRYAKEAGRLKQQKVYSYTHASTYDRLGIFLLKYPGFVYQLQLVSLADWCQDADDGKKMTKCLEASLLSDEEKGTFWKLQPQIENGSAASAIAVASDAAPESECMTCKRPRTGAGSQLWQCSGCNQFFHELCMGYAGGTICADVVVPDGAELETEVFCTNCLFDKELSVDDVSEAIAEVKAIGQFLNAPDCAFKLEKIVEDGYCCFRILENAARKSLGWKGKQAEFCKEVAIAAVKSAEAAAKEIGGEALENEVLKDLNALARESKPIESLKKGLWKRLEVQHILKGFVHRFGAGRVVVNVYQTSGDVRKTDTYRNTGDGSAFVEVNVLHWNMKQHYDCLVKQKR
jgi:hypothetical protein